MLRDVRYVILAILLAVCALFLAPSPTDAGPPPGCPNSQGRC